MEPPFPRLLKTKQEHLREMTKKNLKAIEKYNEHFTNILEPEKKARIKGWSFA